MGTANSLLIIGDNHEEILKFKSKLMLLRDVDSIIESTVEKAIESCRKYIPDTIIIFIHDYSSRFFEICKAVRLDPVLKNTPILFLLDSYEEEYILSAFDAGISDYIVLPSRDSEVLMRVIWCLQRSEYQRDLEKKEVLLAELGVINKETGSYTPEYTAKVFSNEIATAQKYKNPTVLMAISVDKAFKGLISDTLLAGVINKSIRHADILGMPEEGKFYVILPKTRVEGVCTVYERIKNNATNDFTVSIGACELEEGMTFEELSKHTLKALDDALELGNSLVISDKFENKEQNPDDWLDKVQTKSKNYKLFKQAFNKKLNNIISPIFYQVQQRLKSDYPENIVIDQFTTETKCYFSIKDTEHNNEAVLKITDPGLSKVIIDIFYTKSGMRTNDRQKIDLSELDEQYLLNTLEQVITEFENSLVQS